MDPQQIAQPTFWQKYKLTLISLGIIILAAIPLLLLSNTASKKQVSPKSTAVASPTPAPLTSATADNALTQEDTQLQQTITQMDKDLQSVNSVNSSQDTTTGL